MTNSTKLKAYGYTLPPEDVHERKNYYDRELRGEEKMDELEFRNSIDSGEHDKKCLQCYLMGLKFCVYWSYPNLCTEFEKMEVEKTFINFR